MAFLGLIYMCMLANCKFLVVVFWVVTLCSVVVRESLKSRNCKLIVTATVVVKHGVAVLSQSNWSSGVSSLEIVVEANECRVPSQKLVHAPSSVNTEDSCIHSLCYTSVNCVV
jgi:hypothetical protein